MVAMIIASGCSRSNNLALGRVEATVGSHLVVVTDCYRTSVDPPRAVQDGYRFTPCKDADVFIRGPEVIVNGVSYGRAGANDAILVDHGVVSIGAPAGRVTERRSAK